MLPTTQDRVAARPLSSCFAFVEALVAVLRGLIDLCWRGTTTRKRQSSVRRFQYIVEGIESGDVDIVSTLQVASCRETCSRAEPIALNLTVMKPRTGHAHHLG